MTHTACMGGWCAKRDHCHNYHTDQGRNTPAERLCIPGQDGKGLESPVVIRRPVGTWEATKEAA